MAPMEICIEAGKKRVFASALAWPGWSRSAANETAAIEALLAYGPRYAKVLGLKRLGFAAPGTAKHLKVVERLPGDTTTDFGAPSIAGRPPRGAAGNPERRAVLVEALSHAVEQCVPETGPRGGKMWRPRYFVRRTAWHVLDHAWELEDRTVS